MPYVARENVRHNGKTYRPGDDIPGLKKEDAQRLVELGAVEEEPTKGKSAAPATE